jgi:hypothetical protein
MDRAGSKDDQGKEDEAVAMPTGIGSENWTYPLFVSHRHLNLIVLKIVLAVS